MADDREEVVLSDRFHALGHGIAIAAIWFFSYLMLSEVSVDARLVLGYTMGATVISIFF